MNEKGMEFLKNKCRIGVTTEIRKDGSLGSKSIESVVMFDENGVPAKRTGRLGFEETFTPEEASAIDFSCDGNCKTVPPEYEGRNLVSDIKEGKYRITSEYDKYGNEIWHFTELWSYTDQDWYVHENTRFNYDEDGVLRQILLSIGDRNEVIDFYYEPASNPIILDKYLNMEVE